MGPVEVGGHGVVVARGIIPEGGLGQVRHLGQVTLSFRHIEDTHHTPHLYGMRTFYSLLQIRKFMAYSAYTNINIARLKYLHVHEMYLISSSISFSRCKDQGCKFSKYLWNSRLFPQKSFKMFVPVPMSMSTRRKNICPMCFPTALL